MKKIGAAAAVWALGMAAIANAGWVAPSTAPDGSGNIIVTEDYPLSINAGCDVGSGTLYVTVGSDNLSASFSGGGSDAYIPIPMADFPAGQATSISVSVTHTGTNGEQCSKAIESKINVIKVPGVAAPHSKMMVCAGPAGLAGANAGGGTTQLQSLTGVNPVVQVSNGNSAWTNITSTSGTAGYAGQQINTQLSIAGITPASYQWGIEGSVIDYYVLPSAGGGSGSGSHAPSSSELSQSWLSYYWLDAGDPRTVTCSIQFNGDWYDINGVIYVGKPSSAISAVTNTRTGAYLTVGTMWTIATTPNAEDDGIHGIVFTGNLGSFSGSMEWVQIYNTDVRVHANGTSAGWFKNTSDGYELDNRNPYVTGSKAVDCPQTPVSNWADKDTLVSPNTVMMENGTNTLPTGHSNVNLNEMTNDNSARMFLLYNPGTSFQDIYIPVSVADWSWGGDATYNSSALSWTVGAPYFQIDSTSDVSSFPTWTATTYNTVPVYTKE